MSILADNIRYLRGQKKLSQRRLADELHTTRSCISAYEDSRCDPPIEILKRLSKYFHVSIDILISVNVKKISFDQLLQMEDNRILLPISIDVNTEKEIIEIIPFNPNYS